MPDTRRWKKFFCSIMEGNKYEYATFKNRGKSEC